MLDLNITWLVSLVSWSAPYLPRWCCSGPMWWSETIPPHYCRKRSCCTTSAPAAQALQSGKEAPWRWSAGSSSPLLFSDSPLWPGKKGNVFSLLFSWEVQQSARFLFADLYPNLAFCERRETIVSRPPAQHQLIGLRLRHDDIRHRAGGDCKTS